MEQNFNKMNGKVYLIIVSLFLGNWSLNAQQVKKVSMQKEETYQVVDEYADYESINAVNGNIDCLNTEPKYDFSLDNSLKVYNSGVYDMVLKLIDDKDNVATRMIYIKKGTTHEIKKYTAGDLHHKRSSRSRLETKNRRWKMYWSFYARGTL